VSPGPARTADDRRGGWRRAAAWCLYDWANSAFPTVITTFVFGAYFARAVATDSVAGTAQWGYAISLSALAVAIAAPLMGAMADERGPVKPWLFVLTAVCVVATAGLFGVRPDPAYALFALVLVGIANFAFETAGVFYNALLPRVAGPVYLGRVSGWGWGLGYAGGLACLAVALLVLIRADPPPFGLDSAAAEPVRATALLVAVWFAVFSAPLFLLVPDNPPGSTGRRITFRARLGGLSRTLRGLKWRMPVTRFLIAHMIYADGLATLFAFGGIYAAGTFGMDFDELILFGIAINVTAGLGATAFAWIDDRIGPRATILVAIGCLMPLSLALVLVEGKTLFWAFALPLGIFVGPVQAASRTLMARIAPAGRTGEYFGLYALSGKATAFVGPAVLAAVTQVTASQRAGMATILAFFVAGALVLAMVDDPKQRRTAPETRKDD